MPKRGQEPYREHCASLAGLPIFLQPWWLDATCGPDSWGAAMVSNAGRVDAVMPFRLRHLFNLTSLSQPPLTPFLGPWITGSTPGATASASSAREADILASLAGSLPAFSHCAQSWSPRLTNWLPFYWHGFEQTTYYTYVLDDLKNEEALWNDLKGSCRTEIRKASGRFLLKVTTDTSIDEFLALNKAVFARQGLKLPYTEALVRRIDAACETRSCRRIFVAKDEEGRRHAGVYLVWDGECAYYLMGGGDPTLRMSGATSLCMWEAIRFAATVTARFDFFGSMLKPVERFFRTFGATQVPYFVVRKVPSRILRAKVLFSRRQRP